MSPTTMNKINGNNHIQSQLPAPDAAMVDTIKAAIRDIPDFPKPGILFKDITTVLRQGDLLQQTIEYFYHFVKDKHVDYVVGIESRGFILGAPLAYRLGAGFVPVRKKGKLPGPTKSLEYALEYGTDCVEVHNDAIEPGAKVVIIDDLIATGGTAGAAAHLIQNLGADVTDFLFLIELTFLSGTNALPQNIPYHAMIKY
jgi:adenine phosphoribosyltransferase